MPPTVREVADSLEVELRDRFLAMVDVVATSIPSDILEGWIQRRDFPAIIDAFEEIVADSINFATANSLAETYTSLVHGGVRSVGRVSTALNLVSELVLDRIRQDAARLVVGVGKDTIISIRSVLEQGYSEGLGVRSTGRLLREVVGLLPQHTEAVGRYAQLLVNQNVPEPTLSHQVNTYARRLLTYRAENIARTESISAANAGQLQAWLEMANRGVLDRLTTRVVWVVTEDDRLCPWCAPMDGVEVDLGQLFTSTHKGFPEGKPILSGPGSERLRGTLRPDPRSQPRDSRGRYTSLNKRDDRDELDGRLVPLARSIVVAHPPLHPQCRCDLKLRFTS
jgi:hypothetical protein